MSRLEEETNGLGEQFKGKDMDSYRSTAEEVRLIDEMVQARDDGRTEDADEVSGRGRGESLGLGKY
jgi:hypothetical protein